MNDLIFEGVSTRRLLDQIARLRGWDPAAYSPRQEELDRMCQLANHMMERAWRKAMWPQLTLTRSVTYRPSWTEAGAPYPLGSQVFWDGHYWECVNPEGTSEEPGSATASGWTLVSLTESERALFLRYGYDPDATVTVDESGKYPILSIGGTPFCVGQQQNDSFRLSSPAQQALELVMALEWAPGQLIATWHDAGEAKDWAPCERTMTCGISYQRYGIEEMDLVRGVYTLNPDTRADARPLPAYRVAFGAVVQRVPGRPFVAMPWIRFRPYAPRLSAVPWVNNVAYPKGSLVMGSDGDTYEAWVDVETGVDPATANDPAVWAPRRCPRMFEDYVVEAAAAELQTDDNARGRGLQAADKTLNELYNNLVRQINQPGRAMTRVFR